MKSLLTALAATLGMGIASAHAQNPTPEPGFPIPVRALKMMPPEVARQIRADMERVNLDLRRMMEGIPAFEIPAPPPSEDFDLPPIPLPKTGEFRHRQETSFSNVNGCFTLRHCLNGVNYRLSGSMTADQMVVKKIVIEQRGEAVPYRDLSDLPEDQQAVVRGLLKQYQP